MNQPSWLAVNGVAPVGVLAYRCGAAARSIFKSVTKSRDVGCAGGKRVAVF